MEKPWAPLERERNYEGISTKQNCPIAVRKLADIFQKKIS